MYNLASRIKDKRKQKGLNQDELASFLGKKGKQVISNWESGRAEPSLSDIYRLAEILDTTPGYLVDGIIINDTPIPSDDTAIAYWANVDVTGGMVQIENSSESRPTGYIHIPGFEDCEHAVPHFGDSMSPFINGGDIVLLKKFENWMDYVPYGETFLVITNSYRTVKYVRKATSPDKFLLVPHNAAFDAFEIPKSEILHMYLVKGSVQRKLL
ncbi:XRE family transcriptional regulator [Siphonobacter sp. SORGH_AS_1065]|uniref:XRE family transcriptional regulator n=1 Tax=Siphonobacter sp. SORGH_AS_1065 TaxID=3041795 RepID=UPI0027896DCF|nr:XRE family transcriptional regulator [Siphonobacter sp. SORGH_AS_1065]MDQ1089024.1 transcriptional regulator with XRE-family HTH domain [Siphonobacter sp. SORGH_AS_1065]